MTYEARHAKGINYALIGGCLLISLVGFAAALRPAKDGSEHLVGWIIVGACLAAAFVFVRRAADRTVQARVDEAGIYSRRYGEGPVPWSRVASLHVLRAGIQRVARLELRDPPGKTLGVNTTFYDRGIDELIAAVRHHRPDLVP